MQSELLVIQVTPKMLGSIVNDLTQKFIFEWQLANPLGEVTYRNLADNPVPHFSVSQNSAIESKQTELRHTLISEILKADSIFISTPMWNWGPPSVLKAYFDFIIQPGVLDTSNNRKLVGKKVTFLVTQGGSCAPDSPKAGWDHLSGYLRLLAGGLGSEDVEVISIEFTMAEVDSNLAEFVERKVESIKLGQNQICERARNQ